MNNVEARRNFLKKVAYVAPAVMALGALVAPMSAHASNLSTASRANNGRGNGIQVSPGNSGTNNRVENKGNNGFGNGNQVSPGNSGTNNGAENNANNTRKNK